MSRGPSPIDLDALAAALQGHGFGRVVEHRRTIDSTSKLALALAGEGAPEGTVVLAEEQTRGRGRGNHTWLSPRGLGLYLSILLRPARHHLDKPVFGLVGGLAAARAVEEAAGLAAALKWPNDLLVGGRKAGGILAEAFPGRGEAPAVVILGIGVNVHHGPDDLPANTPVPPTSLVLEGWNEADRTALAAAVIRHVERVYGDLRARGVGPLEAGILSIWAERGRWVRLEGGPASDPEVAGRAAGLDLEAGDLILEDAGGRPRRVPLHRFLRLNRRPPGAPGKTKPGGPASL